MPQPQDALRRSRRLCEVLARSENETCNFKHWNLAKWARVSNASDRPATGLRLGPPRDHVAERRNTGRTTARANVEGRHLLSGFAGPVRRRSAHDPRRRIPERRGEPSFASVCKVATLRPRPGFFWPQWVHPGPVVLAWVLVVSDGVSEFVALATTQGGCSRILPAESERAAE
jgi:hypothetical protein